MRTGRYPATTDADEIVKAKAFVAVWVSVGVESPDETKEMTSNCAEQELTLDGDRAEGNFDTVKLSEN